MPLEEIAVQELVNFAIGAIQAYKFTGNEDAVGAEIAKLAAAGATQAQITERLKNMNVEAETQAQADIDAARDSQKSP